MILTLQIKLLPSEPQAEALLDTIKEANAACNNISDVVWAEKVFNQFKIHQKTYYPIKDRFNLSAQVIVRCISKVANAYKLDRKTKRVFRLLGGITYDSRILSYKTEKSIASIWTTNGRQKIPFVCHNLNYLPYIKGEADLVYKNNKFYLFQAVEVPGQDIRDVEEFIGVDFGINNIVALSDGQVISSKWINEYRLKRGKVRGSIQSKGTRSARRLLKRLSGKEKTTAKLINHTLSKRIIEKAVTEGKGIAIENLKGIRNALNKFGKKQRGLYNKWSFHQLRQFLEYKAALYGVKLSVVNPAYTSQACHKCHVIGNRKGKVFTCKTCGSMDADVNAAINISTLGMIVDHPEKSALYSCSLHCEV